MVHVWGLKRKSRTGWLRSHEVLLPVDWLLLGRGEWKTDSMTKCFALKLTKSDLIFEIRAKFYCVLMYNMSKSAKNWLINVSVDCCLTKVDVRVSDFCRGWRLWPRSTLRWLSSNQTKPYWNAAYLIIRGRWHFRISTRFTSILYWWQNFGHSQTGVRLHSTATLDLVPSRRVTKGPGNAKGRGNGRGTAVGGEGKL